MTAMQGDEAEPEGLARTPINDRCLLYGVAEHDSADEGITIEQEREQYAP